MFYVDADSIAYRFGAAGGSILFTYPVSHEPDRRHDVLALGFSTTLSDAVLLRIDSGVDFQDFIEMALVSCCLTNIRRS